MTGTNAVSFKSPTLIVLSAAVWLHPAGAEQHFVSVFSGLQHKFKITWPLPFSNRWDLLDTFGPRYAGSFLTNDGSGGDIRYDFHSGIDIRGREGEPVVSAHRAVVHSVFLQDGDANAGTPSSATVVLKHWFNTDVFLHHLSPTTRLWYTVYDNLGDVNVTVGDSLEGGDDVGTVGRASDGGGTGRLHHELWIGSLCTRRRGESGHETGEDVCAGDAPAGYAEPAVHPLLLYDQMPPWNTHNLRVKPSILVIQPVTAFQDGIIAVSTPNALLHINRYTFEVVTADGTVRLEHSIDLNLRHGFEEHTEEIGGLYSVDQAQPYLRPLNPQNFTFGRSSYSTDATVAADGIASEAVWYNWDMQYVIPSSWIGCKRADETYLIGVIDIWNSEKYLSYGRLGEEWCVDEKQI